jgi:hypothetical protein
MREFHQDPADSSLRGSPIRMSYVQAVRLPARSVPSVHVGPEDRARSWRRAALGGLRSTHFIPKPHDLLRWWVASLRVDRRTAWTTQTSLPCFPIVILNLNVTTANSELQRIDLFQLRLDNGPCVCSWCRERQRPIYYIRLAVDINDSGPLRLRK